MAKEKNSEIAPDPAQTVSNAPADGLKSAEAPKTVPALSESTLLTGEAELAARKGTWTYQADVEVEKPVLQEIHEEIHQNETPEEHVEPQEAVFEEVETEEKPMPAKAAEPKVVERVVEKKSGFFPALLGGIVAAGLGFFAAQSNLLGDILPESMRGPTDPAVAELQSSVEAQSATLAELQAAGTGEVGEQIAGIEGQIAELIQSVEAITDDTTTLTEAVTGIESRLATLEAAPPGAAGGEAAASNGSVQGQLQQQLAALQDALDQQRAEVATLVDDAKAAQADAQTVERQATARAALANVLSALNSGAPYSEHLTVLADAGQDVPDGLTAGAETGVATQSVLVETFPAAARDALAAAREQDGEAGGMVSFLQRQLGARSVQPQEGEHADAVLSRAEAMVLDGQLGGALDELSALPELAQAAMSDWTQLATTRHQALEATRSLFDNLNSN